MSRDGHVTGKGSRASGKWLVEERMAIREALEGANTAPL